MKIQTTEYGWNLIGKPYLSCEGTWFRNDNWFSRGTGDTFVERRFASDVSDESPLFLGEYDCRCSCCYLGFSHTVDAHNKRAVKHGN